MYLYNFASYYKVEDISPPQLQVLLDDMKVYASDSFHHYYDMNTVATDHESIIPCSCDCKTSHLCAIEFVDYDEFDECYAEQAACGADKVNSLGLFVMILGLILARIQ